jgi:hypothetical protein
VTKALKQAFDAASQLPNQDQDTIAAVVLEELDDERAWQASFAKSQDVLAYLADEARADHEAGRTEELDPDTL